MAAYVCDHQSMRPVFEFEEIKVIAADNISWPVERSNFNARDHWRAVWHQSALNDLRELQFRFQPAAFDVRIVVKTHTCGVVHFKQGGFHNALAYFADSQCPLFELVQRFID